VQAGAGGDSRVTINLDVTEDLKITGAAGSDGDSSLGVFYERDY
jgi:translocation and assembly module TamB